MSSLSPVGLAFYMLVITGAFAVRSAAGFGAVLIALPMLAFFMPVPTAVSVTTALTAITSVHQVGRHWRRVAWAQFAIIAFYSAIGIGIGFYFINLLDEHQLRRGLGVFLMLYALYALATAGGSPVLPSGWRPPWPRARESSAACSVPCSVPESGRSTWFISIRCAWSARFSA